MRTPQRRWIQRDGLRLCAVEWPGVEPAIVFAHGNGFHARCWDAVIAHLPDRRCVALDLRGHGLSGAPVLPVHWPDFGADVIAATREIVGQQAIGVGHSLGGHAITLAAALVPHAFAALLLLDPVILPRDAYGHIAVQVDFVERRRNRWSSPQEMFERFKTRPPFQAWQPEVLRDYCEHGLRPAPDGNGFVLACAPETEASIYTMGSAADADIYTEIAHVHAPVCVIRSGHSMRDAGGLLGSPTAPNLAAHFPSGCDIVASGNSHFIPMESPQQVATWVEELTARYNPSLKQS